MSAAPHVLSAEVARCGEFGADRLEIYTVPYTAQFHNPFSADGQMSYNDSRAEGFDATVRAMTDMNNRCPLTSYVLVGFSQGAVIAGFPEIGVSAESLPLDLLRELKHIAEDVLREEAEADEDFATILASQQRFRAEYAHWKARAYLPRDF